MQEQPPAPQPLVLRTLRLTFPRAPLYPRQIPQWRGAVSESAGPGSDLFHNHAAEAEAESDGTLHRPALIHYRSAGGCAVLWGMNEGAAALLRWHNEAPDALTVGGRPCPLNPVEMQRGKSTLARTDGWRYYRIHDYLALNPDNYRLWLEERRLIARAEILEKALAAHLLAFCQAAGYWLEEHLDVELVEQHQYRKTRYHGVDVLGFELTYRCNLDLPDEVALGKAVSHGFGVQRRAPRF